MDRDIEALVDQLRAFSFAFPGAWEDHPWGESVAKVGPKVFVFFGTAEKPRHEFGFCVKLPESGLEAKLLPFVEPATYGMGKYGWVIVKIGANQAGMMPTFRSWIVESYRAIAPKKLVAELDSGAAEPAARTPRKAARKAAPKTSKKKSARKPAAKRTKKKAARKPASKKQSARKTLERGR